jgi:LPXTG-motif cell wall-anchored protein
MVASTNPRWRAAYVDLTIDAGVVWVTTVQGVVSMNGAASTPGASVGDGVPGVVVMLLDESNRPVLGLDGLPVMVITDAQGAYALPNVVPGRYRLAYAPSIEAARSGRFAFVGELVTVYASASASPMVMPVVDGHQMLSMSLPATGSGSAPTLSVAALLLGVGLAAWLAADRRRRRTMA